MNLLYFLITGLAIFIFLKFGARILDALLLRMSLKPETTRWFPLVEIVIWVAYVYWGSYVLFGHIRYYDLLVLSMTLLLAFGIAWFFFRDFFAGLMVRSDYGLKTGLFIRTPVAEGYIVRLGSRFLELKNDKGEMIKLPFSQISRQWLQLPADMGNSLSSQLLISLPGDINVPLLRKTVEAEMMGMPWIIGTPPGITIRMNQQGQIILDVRYDLLKEEHSLQVEKRVREIVAMLQQPTQT